MLSYIYIPLWFYSNSLDDAVSIVIDVFTFHYGSILIIASATFWFLAIIFTFHYGSILMSFPVSIKSLVGIFTFHYGSILIHSECY